MNPSDLEGFENLGKFFDDDQEDLWEKNEAKAEYISDRYQDKEFIASGALKNVFKVFDTKMKRDVALAELKEEIPEEEYEDFINEARLTSSLRHPNIITVHDFGFNEIHIPYFTMELKVGFTLAEIIKTQKKSLNELLEIFLKVCDAIAYSHSQEVVHLDLKPANIQVGEFGEVQVCDWGLSRKTLNLFTEDKIKGTPGFMAPEQVIPGEAIDCQADIYALGGILYAILTGVTPLEGGSKTVILETIKGGIVDPIERFPDKSIPESLNAVVCKAMDTGKDNRYKTVEKLKSEVANFLMGKSTIAENAGFVKELSLFVKRNKQICTLSLVSFIILFVGALVFILEIQRSKSETEKALTDLKKVHLALQESKKQEQSLFEQKEKTFKMFIQASEESQELYEELRGTELTLAYELMVYPLYFGSPKQNLEKSLEILKSQYDPKNPQSFINDLIVLNLFISQKFEELQKYESEKYKSLIKVASKYMAFDRSNFGVLLDRDFIVLLEDINSLPVSEQKIKQDVMERVICYSQSARGVKFLHGKIVRELIQCWNPDSNLEGFSFRKNANEVSLSGENLRVLRSKDLNSSRECFLRFLRVDNLDLRGSGITSLAQIEGLSVKEVDIRDTKITNLHPHNATKTIQVVYLNSGQFDPDSKFVVPKSIKLVYKD